MGKRVAVTGASGFVGRALCRILVAEGHTVVGVTRSAERLAGSVAARITGLDDAAGLRAAFEGADAVVHLAARVHVMSETALDPQAEFRRVNVDGTRAVLAATRESGAGQFVFVSSIKVNGDAREAPYSEADTPRPTDPYGQSKLDAEAAIRAGAGKMSWTVIRPPLVYGPEVGGNFRRLLRLAGLASRWPLPLGGIDNLRSMIFVDNLAAAIAAAIARPAARERTFLVSDDHDVGVSELLQRLAVDLGGRPRLFRAPVSLIHQAGRLLGREADIDRVFGTLRVNSNLIQSTLQWRPPVALDDGLGVTARWWRSVRLA
jgi:UDP-glucose 4-epimerase